MKKDKNENAQFCFFTNVIKKDEFNRKKVNKKEI